MGHERYDDRCDERKTGTISVCGMPNNLIKVIDAALNYCKSVAVKGRSGWDIRITVDYREKSNLIFSELLLRRMEGLVPAVSRVLLDTQVR